MLARLLLALALLPWAIPVRAGFAFNFAPDPAHRAYSGQALAVCNMPGQTDINCISYISHGGTTPFLQEKVQDPATGKIYFHVVIGQPGSGFAMEYFSKDGFPSGGQDSSGSSSFGGNSCTFMMGGITCNGQDPLGDVTGNRLLAGNGTGGSYLAGGSAVGEVSVLQLLGVHTQDPATGQWTCADSYCGSFEKAWGQKPRIQQRLAVTSGGATVQGRFELDLSGQSMLVLPAAATAPTVTLSVTAPGGGPGSFDLATDASQAAFTAGRYCRGTPDASGQCTPPTRPSDWTGVNLNQYSYFDGAMPLDQDWSLYKDPGQN